MMSTSDFIKQVMKMNIEHALIICREYGNGCPVLGLEAVKRKYAKRPSENSYADLKAIIDVLKDQ